MPENIELNLDSCVIKAARQVKLLGVTLDRHLTFKDHITDVINTCNGYLGVLKRSAHLLPRQLLKMFYTAIIRANLEYASSLLVPVAKVHLDKLDIVQRKAARIIFQVPADSHAEPLLNELGLEPLRDRRDKHLLAIVNSCLEKKIHPELIHKFLREFPNEEKLSVPVTRTKMGKKSFSSVGSAIYNESIKTTLPTCHPPVKGSAKKNEQISKNMTTLKDQRHSPTLPNGQLTTP